jgi:hypothetical protein
MMMVMVLVLMTMSLELLDNYEHADEIQAIVELMRHSASVGSSQYFLKPLKVDEQSVPFLFRGHILPIVC